MKYKTEKDFCVATTKILLGLAIGTGRKLIAIPEVPWGCFSNEQFDMMLLDVKNLEYLAIEYKLNDLDGLRFQTNRLGSAVGIINAKTSDNTWNIFGYTGEDGQIERIDKVIFQMRCYSWTGIYEREKSMVYYWAYKNRKSDLNGGITGGGREGFASVYIRAIKNLHAHYGKLDFMVTHSMLNSGYSVGTGKKYYRQATKN
ncbi:hypothetical protein LCGC14_1538280 [marine sediment metagenome]|uniref:Uncharacterized protein n=1 Tax=marine sediment metagenome TaxID=412755 RepID=A0A0F9IU20_9ZZZZ